MNYLELMKAYVLQRYENRVYAGDKAKQYAKETDMPLEIVEAMDLLADYFVALDLANPIKDEEEWQYEHESSNELHER